MEPSSSGDTIPRCAERPRPKPLSRSVAPLGNVKLRALRVPMPPTACSLVLRRYELFKDMLARVRRNVIYNVYQFQPTRLTPEDRQKAAQIGGQAGAQQQVEKGQQEAQQSVAEPASQGETKKQEVAAAK